MSKWMPTGLGAEPKKVMFLIGLLVLAPAAYWYGNSDTTPAAPATSAKKTQGTLPVVEPTTVTRQAPRTPQRSNRGGNEDFHPTLKLPDDFDLTKVDPTLRTDLLAKVREGSEGGSSRSLFEFYTPPPPPPPPVKINPTPVPPPSAFAKSQEPPAQAVKQVPPPPPPIPFKYFGYQGTPRGGGKLRGHFVEGEDTYDAAEGETIKNRYRIVRIGTTAAEVEDTVAKNTQTLRIVDPCENSSAGCNK